MDIPLNSANRIGVFRALQLGDMLCAVPALRALRAAAPHARITLIGLPWARDFVCRFHRYVDEHASFPGFPGLPEQPADIFLLPEFIKNMQGQCFDLMLQMHGSGLLTNSLVAMFGARRNGGFYSEGNFCPDRRGFVLWNERQHEVHRNLQLLAHFGATNASEHMEFPLDESDYRALQTDCPELPAPGTYVCIHPGARLQSRRWNPIRFAEVADCLRSIGLEVVLTGSQDELDLVKTVAHAMHHPPLNLCGRTHLGALAALVSGARLVVCNDTGMSHIAAAVGTASVVICCGADPLRWAPLNRRRHRTLIAQVPCRPCAYQACPTDHACAAQVQVQDVVNSAHVVLAENPPACNSLFSAAGA